ncbi:MAG: DUF4153 domain-containing protein [Prolixibacteraceae bacterium]|nr:DUF4153 domain-containing protein [Prolixibacteraceae bacterium]
MKEAIKENIDHPPELEKLYRSDKKGFEKAFFGIYPEILDAKIAAFWKERLEYGRQKEGRVTARKTDVLFLILTCLVAGFLITIPRLFDMQKDSDFFYMKNAGLIIFFGLSAYSFLTTWQRKIKHLVFFALIFFVSAVFINALPNSSDSQTMLLACIHLPLFLWCVYGLIYVNFDMKNRVRRIDYIRYNGDMVILAAIIAIAGGILTAVTMGLFSAIEIDIENFYTNFVVIPAAVCIWIVATYIVKSFPAVTNKIAPIIARIFTPLVLITLIVYMVSIIASGKNPYTDRDFLILFNIMLLGVMAIIVFSVSGISANEKRRFEVLTLLVLSILAIIVDLVALSAIVYRLGEFGFTPNRTAVLGSNLLIFGNLVLITIDLFKVCFKGGQIKRVENTVAKYLPVYMIWTILVTFVFPLIFGVK